MKYSLSNLFVLICLFSCMQPVPRKPISNKPSTYLEKSVAFNKSLNETEEDFFKDFMEQDSLTTYIASSNGFWYTYNFKSEKKYKPQFGDKLEYSFEVLDTNLNIIYSFEENGTKMYVVDKQELLEGLRNGLKLMNEGDFVTFLFPSHKVFGYLGDENKIGINQPLIYKVKLNKIERKNESN